MTIFYALISVALVSLISLIGVFFLALQDEVLKKYVSIFISLAVGALLGDAFIHIIPEAFKNSPNITTASIFIIIGIARVK